VSATIDARVAVGPPRATGGERHRTRRRGIVATLLAAMSVVALGSSLRLASTHLSARSTAELSMDVAFILPYLLVGIVLVWKRPTNLVGWLLVGCGSGMALATSAITYADISLGSAPGALPTDLRLALLGNPLSTVAIGFGLVLLPLLFPDGSPLSARWRWVVRVALVAMITIVLTGPFAESDLRAFHDEAAVELGTNPFAAWPGAGLLRAAAIASFITLLLLIPVAFASLVRRHLRGGREERLQIRWVLSAAGVFLAAAVLLGSDLLFTFGLPELLWDTLLGVTFAVVPVAIGVAVLRYHLYEIDRVISRVVSYAALTVVLVSVYAAGVLGLGAAGRAMTGGGGDLAVAASTLAVAALFSPARRLVQSTVDRRFNRARFDAQHTVEAFAHRLRDEVDLHVLRGELLAVVGETFQPRSVGLWTPARGGGHPATNEASSSGGNP
jgi:MFS family permease